MNSDYQKRFGDLVTDDLDTPRALALAWEVAKDASLSIADKTATLIDFDRVLGLGFMPRVEAVIPNDIKELVRSREEARQTKNWAESDMIRDEINARGWNVLDTDNGQELHERK